VQAKRIIVFQGGENYRVKVPTLRHPVAAMDGPNVVSLCRGLPRIAVTYIPAYL
jgi:hypothetical protein